jgi:hypothetical protein
VRAALRHKVNPESFSLTWESRASLLGYTVLVDAFVNAFVDACKAEGKIWPPPST